MRGSPTHIDIVDADELLAGVDRVEAFAAANGVAIPRSSRLGRYIAVLRGLNSGRCAHRGPLDVAGASFEMRQLVAIVDGLKANPSTAAALRVLLDGHYLTLDAPTRDPARDRQFELLVAARLALGGLSVHLGEPDIVVDLCGSQLGIAAKRPRAAAGIKSAIQKGGRQVRKASARGLLAIDASMYPLSKALVLAAFVDKIDDVQCATADRLRGLIYENLELLRPRLMQEPERSGTLGILFHLAIPFMVDGDRGYTAAVGEAWLVIPAKLRLFPALATLLRCLGPNAQALALSSRTKLSTLWVTEKA